MNALLALLMSMNVHTVHLTFDDGPDTVHTPQILSILEKEQVNATFFLVGTRIEDKRAIGVVKRIVNDGNDIGGHSMTHKMLTKVPFDVAKLEILDSMYIVRKFQDTRLFRFPYGASSPALRKIVSDAGYTTVSWDVDSLDWKYKNKEEIYEKFKVRMARCKDGSIVLMHDIHAHTVEVLPQIIRYLKDNNIAITKLEQ
jgi:peptidoglycan/xylan/chitin deacetylase (PgdA/CDA1 family)